MTDCTFCSGAGHHWESTLDGAIPHDCTACAATGQQPTKAQALQRFVSYYRGMDAPASIAFSAANRMISQHFKEATS
jgi:hypothetical protein